MEIVFCLLFAALIICFVVVTIMCIIYGIRLLIDREWFGIVFLIFGIASLLISFGLTIALFILFL